MAEQKLTGEERSTLYWELSRLCRAGLSWQESVDLIGKEAATPALRTVVGQLERSLTEGGASLPGAVEAVGSFPVWHVRLLEIGEASGRLDQVLEALSGYDKRESAAAAALREASVYPLVMAAFIGVIFLFLGWKVMPIFQGVFTQMGMSGPGLVGRVVVMVLGGVFLLGAAALLLRLRLGGGTPVTGGKAAVAAARSRFASAMALMLQSGLSMEESMERTAALLSDSPLAGAVERCRAAVLSGTDLARAVGDTELLDPFQVSLIAAGGRAGRLPEAMEEAEQRGAEEARVCRERSASRFEFALVAFLCAAVAGVLLSVMLPLLQVLSALGA